MSEVDPTNPSYYKEIHRLRGEPIECIDVIECFDLDFSLGSALKYVWRLGSKKGDPVLDLNKAEWYHKRWLGHGSVRTNTNHDKQEIRMAIAGDVAQMIHFFRSYLTTGVLSNSPALGLIEYVDELITEFMEGYGDELEEHLR